MARTQANTDNEISYNKSFELLSDILASKDDGNLQLTSFEDFVIRVFSKSYPQYNFNTWHVIKICKFLDEVIKSKNQLGELVLPRYHLKSTLCGYAFSIYRFLTSYGDSLYCSYKSELADLHLSNIKNAVAANPILAPIMKDMHPQSDYMVGYKIGKKRVRMHSAGIFGMKRGLHTDGVVITDDVLGTVENPLSLADLEKSEKMFNEELINIPNRGCPLILFGTVIDYSDLLFKIRDNEEFSTLWMPAVKPDPEHEVLWEAQYDKEWLEARKRQSGWKSFSTEFLLTPVMALESFFTREDLDKVVNLNLKNYPYTDDRFDKKTRRVVAGFDVGKRRHPSHLSVFVDNQDEKLIQIHESFWDETEYIEQIRRLNLAIENFEIDRLYIDGTRGEMEERGLPRQAVLIKFTGRGERNQMSFATGFAKRVESQDIELLNSDRYLAQILCMTNELKAAVTSSGHADSFWSTALAIGAYEDCFSTKSRKKVLVLGNMMDTFLKDEKKPIMSFPSPDNEDICRICKKRTLDILDDGTKKCRTCFTTWQ